MILTKYKIDSIDFDKLIEEKILSKKINELLLIVPTNRKIRHLKKELISASPDKSSGKINLETIGTFSSKLVLEDSFSNRLLSDAAAKVLLKQAFEESELKYFSLYKSDIPDGTLERIKNVISEYKMHGISDDDLLREAEKLETSEKLKAEDIAHVYKAYGRRCRELGVRETGDIYEELNTYSSQEFESKFIKIYPDVRLILIDGFDEFTIPETQIINSMSNITGCNLFLRFDYYQGNNYIFSHLDGSYEKFLEKGFSKIEDRSYFPKKDFQELIRRRLFKTGHADKNSKFSDSVNVIKAGTREKEVELISKEIKELLIKKKVEPHKICVVFNLIQQYSPAVRDIFSLNGIPFNLTDRFALQTFYPVIEIIKLLEVLENDFYYKDVSSVLGGALFDKDEIDSYNLLQTAVKLKLVAGYENQIAKISDAKKSLERYKDGQDNSVKKAKLEKALADLKTLKKILAPFDKEMSPPEFLDNLKRLIYTRNLPAKILNGMEERKEENLKSIESLLETVDELCDLFALEYGEKKKFDLGFYLKNLRTAVKGVRFNTKEKSNYGVLVTNLNEIRGFNFEYIFIGGLTDGDLPTRYSPEIFFSGSFCKNDLRHITEERYHFYQSLCSWSKELYLSYPEKEKKKELTKSSFLAEFQALFTTGIITEEKFANKLYNIEEVLRMAGAAEFADAEDIYTGNSIDIKKIRNDIRFYSDRIINPFAEAAGNGYIYNGLTDDEKEKLARLKNENYSITQLETYSLCPFRYYIDRVLSLNEIEEPKEEIEAFELGSLIHSILYEYYKVTSARGIDAASQNKEESLEAEKILYDIAEKKIEDAGFYSPFSFYEKERILGLNGKKEESILYRFLEVEKNRNVNFTPSYFEIAFGKNRYEESSAINLKVENVSVTGKIDRIDVDGGQKRYKIIDYKSGGKKPKEEELKEGLSLQLPLYMYAAKELLKEKTGGEFQPAAADIFSLKLGKDFGRSSILPAKQRGNYDAATDEQKTELITFNEELIETCKRSIVNYVDAISKGAFNISKLKDRKNRACKYCAHSSICRVDEITEGKN